MIFQKHLKVLKEFYGNPCAGGVVTGGKSQWMVPTIISKWDLDVQQGLLNLTMKSNATQAMVEVSTLLIPLILNPLAQLWKVVKAS